MFGTASPEAAVAAPLLIALLCLGSALAMSSARGRTTRRRLEAPAARPAPSPSYVSQRDELLATLGHELRSPLRALLALLDGDAEGGTSNALRSELRSLAAHALRVAEDSLDFALLEQGAVRLTPARIDLEHELAALLAVVRPLRTRGVALELDLAPGLAVVREGDGARVRQILVNLVANALAHTEHGSVRVSLGTSEENPGAVRFVVRDSGTGMTPTERQRAFRPFAQGDAPRGRAGIGLAVVARFVEAMGGEVFLESEPGLGSRFVVDLPLPVLEPAPDGAAELAGRLVGVCCADPAELRSVAAHLQHWQAEVLRFPDAASLAAHLETERPLDALVLGSEELPGALREDIAAREARGLLVARSTADDATARLPGALLRALTPHADARDAPGALADLEVLVVDDHPVVRRVLHRLLTGLGCRVTCAEDGASAVELASDPEEAFDWVLLDRRMPGLDGLSTAARLREAVATREARIALLVNDASDDPGSARLFDHVLVRPQRPDALRSLLALTLSDGRRREKARFSVTGDEKLADLRDETLREDLAGLQRARRRADHEGVADRLHRMEGALRLCPETGLRRALDELQHALDRDAGVTEALEVFSERLGVVPTPGEG